MAAADASEVSSEHWYALVAPPGQSQEPRESANHGELAVDGSFRGHEPWRHDATDIPVRRKGQVEKPRALGEYGRRATSPTLQSSESRGRSNTNWAQSPTDNGIRMKAKGCIESRLMIAYQDCGITKSHLSK